jgi:hypothetical protein
VLQSKITTLIEQVPESKDTLLQLLLHFSTPSSKKRKLSDSLDYGQVLSTILDVPCLLPRKRLDLCLTTLGLLLKKDDCAEMFLPFHQIKTILAVPLTGKPKPHTAIAFFMENESAELVFGFEDSTCFKLNNQETILKKGLLDLIQSHWKRMIPRPSLEKLCTKSKAEIFMADCYLKAKEW